MAPISCSLSDSYHALMQALSSLGLQESFTQEKLSLAGYRIPLGAIFVLPLPWAILC